jgi:serine/threonine protein kinase
LRQYYDSGAAFCEENGAALKVVASPRLLSNRYRLEQRLGEGGMGRVYRASDLALGRSVAVKMIKEELSGDFEAIKRFRREAQISAHFAHANIVSVFDFGIEADDRAFLVMELLRGTTLREELRIHKKLEPSSALMIFEQICAGVSAAHAMGVVHRDLKPENIFLDTFGLIHQVKITDFGIAKSFRQPSKDTLQTRTGVVVGTFNYMSPEQLSGQELSPMWDIWALSVIAFESLCGTTPFSGGDIFAHQDIGGQIPQFTGRTSVATPSLQKFFEETFHPAEAMRPQTIAAFWNNLRNALA